MKKRDEIIVSSIVERDLDKLDRIAIDLIETSVNNSRYTEWLKKLQTRQTAKAEGENDNKEKSI